nr:YheC/YheD family protein [uncultured Bacillus sp.]
MEFINSMFFLGEDKELVLQMLKINNVPAVEIVDANHCSYPVIGRKFGHHSGSDIRIVHSEEQSWAKDFDYLTKLYVIPQEYKLEVFGTAVRKVEKAVVHTAVKDEIPIRTVSKGWNWVEIDKMELYEEWKQLAVRAVYVIGQHHACVKLGILNNDKPIVVDIDPLPALDIQQGEAGDAFTIGADIEFMLSCDNELLPASEFFPLEGQVGCDERQIEQDSGDFALAEIRPEHSASPHDLFHNIQTLIADASKMIPYQNISIHAGSMPFYGYQCGGHLHFGIKPSVPLLRTLDYFLAIPLAMIEQSDTSRRRRKTKHGGLGRFREKPYGFEYLSLSSWIIKPEITLAVLCLAKLTASHYEHLKTTFLYHPLIQRAYYQGNQAILRTIWHDIKTQIMDQTDYTRYEKELNPFFTFIEEGSLLKENKDIRRNWKLEIPVQKYERGFIIQIPKKLREKFTLDIGQETYVCAGKSISKAVIRPYPFTFRNCKIIQLSPKLREALSLPLEWNPIISSANGALILGPILGILANRPFERQATYFQHISKIALQKQMLVYVFEPKDIIWDRQLIKGTTMNGEGIFPFPSVIYDRFFYAQKKQSMEIEEIRAKLEFIYQIPFINSPRLFALTGNKWFTHVILKETHEEFLPDTRTFQQNSDIKEMLDRYGELFIKPVGGALGKGIVQVIQTSSGMFWVHSKNAAYQPLHSIEELTATLFPQIQCHSYLIQEAVKRKQINEHFVEIRVYMQKNGRKKWVRTGMVARLTNKGVITPETEMNRRASYVLRTLYPDSNDQRKIKNQIANVAKSVVEAIEKQTGVFGELAVDICIDQFDRIKILEVNGKPDNLFSQVNAYKLRNSAVHRLLNYAAALSGLEWNDNSEKENSIK